MQKYAALLGGLGAVAVLFALRSFRIQLLSGGGLLLPVNDMVMASEMRATSIMTPTAAMIRERLGPVALEGARSE